MVPLWYDNCILQEYQLHMFWKHHPHMWPLATPPRAKYPTAILLWRAVHHNLSRWIWIKSNSTLQWEATLPFWVCPGPVSWGPCWAQEAHNHRSQTSTWPLVKEECSCRTMNESWGNGQGLSAHFARVGSRCGSPEHPAVPPNSLNTHTNSVPKNGTTHYFCLNMIHS